MARPSHRRRPISQDAGEDQSPRLRARRDRDPRVSRQQGPGAGESHHAPHVSAHRPCPRPDRREHPGRLQGSRRRRHGEARRSPGRFLRLPRRAPGAGEQRWGPPGVLRPRGGRPRGQRQGLWQSGPRSGDQWILAQDAEALGLGHPDRRHLPLGRLHPWPRQRPRHRAVPEGHRAAVGERLGGLPREPPRARRRARDPWPRRRHRRGPGPRRRGARRRLGPAGGLPGHPDGEGGDHPDAGRGRDVGDHLSRRPHRQPAGRAGGGAGRARRRAEMGGLLR